MLELSLEEHEILEQQMSLNVMLVNAVWGDARSDEIQLGLRNTEVIILNDIGNWSCKNQCYYVMYAQLLSCNAINFFSNYQMLVHLGFRKRPSHLKKVKA